MAQSEISPQEMYELICNAELPEVQAYEARDRSLLYFRHYPAESNNVVRVDYQDNGLDRLISSTNWIYTMDNLT